MSISNYIGSITRPSISGSVSDPTYGSITGQANALGTFDFTAGTQFSSLISYTGTSARWRFNSAGILTQVASGIPRANQNQDFNPSDLSARGFLIEQQSTNLFTYSEDFSNSDWTKSSASVSADAIISPDGTQNADKLVEGAAGDGSVAHLAYEAKAITSGSLYATSIFAKAAERTKFETLLGASGYGANVTCVFDLSAVSATIGVSGTNTSASIVAIGNGWYRCILVSQATASASPQHQFRISNGSTTTYVGNGSSGIYLWGAQLE